jgi:phage-related protein
MNNFHLTGKQMPQIADLVAGAANASAISVDEFASSLSQVGAVANLAGLSFEDTAVAIAEMGNAGIKGSDAGTSLKTMLMNLIPTTKQQINEFERLGISTWSASKASAALKKDGIDPLSGSFDDVSSQVAKFIEAQTGAAVGTDKNAKATQAYIEDNVKMQNAFFTAEGKVKSLAGIQQVLQDSTKGMTKEQKLASLELLFGADAIRGAAVMADNGAAGYNKLATAMGKVTAAQVAETRLNNFRGSLEKLKGSLETIMIQIGSVVLPIAKKFVDILTWMADKVISMNEHSKVLGVTLAAIGTAIALITGAITVVIVALAPFILKMMALAAIRGVYKLLAGEVALIGGAAKAGTGPVGLLTLMMGRMKLAMDFVIARALLMVAWGKRLVAVATFLAGPWGLVIKILLAVVAAGVVLYNTYEPFRNLVKTIASAVTDGLAVAMQWLTGVIVQAAIASQPFFEWIGTVAVAAVKALQDGIGYLVDGFSGVSSGVDPVQKTLNSFGDTARNVWDALKMLWGVIQDSLLPAFVALGQQLGGAWLSMMQAIADVVMNALWPALKSLGDVLRAALGPAIAALGDAWKALLPALQQVADLITGTVWPALQKLWEALGPIIGVVLQVVGVILGGLIIGLIYLAAFILGKVVPAIIGVLVPVLTTLIQVISNVAVWIVQYLITPFVQFLTFLIGELIPGIIQFVGDMAKAFVDGFNAVMAFFGGIVQWFKDVFTNIGNAFQSGADAGTSAWDGVVAFFQGVWDAIMAGVNSVIGFFTAAWTNIWAVIGPPIMLMGQLIGAVFNVIWVTIVGITNLIVAILLMVWNTIVLQAQIAWTTTLTTITEAWNAILLVITTVATAIWTFIVMIWNIIVQSITVALNVIFAVVSAIWSAILAVIVPILTAIWTFISSVWNNIMAVVSAVMSAIFAVVSAIWSAIFGFVSGIVSSILAVVSAIWNAISGFISGVMSRIFSVVSSVWNSVYGSVSGAVNNIFSAVSGAFNSVVSTVSGAVGRVYSAVVGKFNEVVSFVSGIGGRILGAIGNLGSLLFGAGQSIIQGFLDGLASIAGNIESFFADITSKIPKIKGPPEHDKVMLTPAGKLIMNSLKNGLQAGVDDALGVLENLNMSIPLTLQSLGKKDFNALKFTPEMSAKMVVSPLAINKPEEKAPVSDIFNVDKLIVENAVPETASDSLPKAIRKLSLIGAPKP